MSKRQVETSIEIEATPERIWALLTDFAHMPDWNPFIRSIAGSPAKGSRLAVEIALPGKGPMPFKPVVIVSEPGRELCWLARLLLPGVFDGEHYFRIEPIGANRIRFIHGERFSGVLVPLLGGIISAAEHGYAAMNRALKQRAERQG